MAGMDLLKQGRERRARIAQAAQQTQNQYGAASWQPEEVRNQNIQQATGIQLAPRQNQTQSVEQAPVQMIADRGDYTGVRPDRASYTTSEDFFRQMAEKPIDKRTEEQKARYARTNNMLTNWGAAAAAVANAINVGNGAYSQTINAPQNTDIDAWSERVRLARKQYDDGLANAQAADENAYRAADQRWQNARDKWELERAADRAKNADALNKWREKRMEAEERAKDRQLDREQRSEDLKLRLDNQRILKSLGGRGSGSRSSKPEKTYSFDGNDYGTNLTKAYAHVPKEYKSKFIQENGLDPSDIDKEAKDWIIEEYIAAVEDGSWSPSQAGSTASTSGAAVSSPYFTRSGSTDFTKLNNQQAQYEDLMQYRVNPPASGAQAPQSAGQKSSNAAVEAARKARQNAK